MRIHPKANAKGARKRLAKQANSRQNGLGKYQQTGLLVSFWRTSQRHVFERAQPPTLQQGGSPMLMVLEGWTLAAILSTAVWCYTWWVSWALSCRLVAGLPDARLRPQNGLPRARAERLGTAPAWECPARCPDPRETKLSSSRLARPDALSTAC